MKEINAYWEERNTGLKTCELIFNSTDTIEDYYNSFTEQKYKHIVAKIPKQNINLVHELEEVGFRFMETQFNISVATKELQKIDKKWNRVLVATSYKRLENKKELKFLTSKIMDGMFKEDRISLDDRLGEEISSKRYVNWIKDIYNENIDNIFLIEKNNSLAGFFVMKNVKFNTYQALIAGIFKEYQGQGLPLAIIYYYLKIASEKKGINVITSFSSNNHRMLNAFTKTVSFKILGITYILRKIVPY